MNNTKENIMQATKLGYYDQVVAAQKGIATAITAEKLCPFMEGTKEYDEYHTGWCAAEDNEPLVVGL